jgi:uncharacterized protein (DUF362 family)
VNSHLFQEKISVLKLNATSDIQQCIRKGIELIGGLSLRSDASVVIKPNLCCIKPPETGATTDVKVVEAIISYLMGTFGISEITIVESDATQVLADMAFKLLGYKRLADKYGIKLENLSKQTSCSRNYPQNVFIKEVQVPEVFEKSDFFISVPKIKTHMDCFLTCALKNQFGCNPLPRKTKYHKKLTDAIVDFNTVFKPNLVIVDGLVALEGHRGPTDGLPVRMNTLIFGADAVAIDHFVARIIGLEPNDIKYLAEAERRGLGSTKYEVKGVGIKEIERNFQTTRPCLRNFYGLFNRF